MPHEILVAAFVVAAIFGYVLLVVTVLDLRRDLDAATELLFAAADEITALGGRPFHRAKAMRQLTLDAEAAHRETRAGGWLA